jgi:hypothetical protein
VIDIDLIRDILPFTTLGLLLILSNPAIASTYESYGFGSKVNLNDWDAGYPLDISCFDFGFRDIGKEKGTFDENDPVYLDMNADSRVSINDIRITSFALFPPGSKVTLVDADIDAPLSSLLNWSIVSADKTENEIYDLQDPLYLHDSSLGNEIVPGDIRLTFFGDLKAGTRVIDSNRDIGIPVFDLMKVMPTNYTQQVAAIRFYNANGNYLEGKPIYDSPDAVYLDISIPDQNNLDHELMGLVVVNDLRLSA